MKVHLSDEQEDLPIDATPLPEIVEAVLALEGKSGQEISISFLNEEAMCQLHAEHFNDPTITDCMSFPIDDEMLGDIVVCPKVALDYPDPYEETTLYLVHGLLHLIGYDDIEEEDRKEMRKAEARAMTHLKTQGLILRPC